ncbi:vacuolar protein sorting-associated protein 41 [Punctularia strigosozonata HHB-11173 SS5]|uniref:vacuolar protein sorting-associated protein 41 n=1 Tax=Punctularia strigosozonata (strain HHB-11173) TaxID=741275 RepID=UPI000441767B|nr:vacuolar protein sorting-associated protein 41 [Punctularia strigosozonata HHB-11173 SS5]EIN11015.1 vacuolar protein sorting-associated protein 41 [Punctularia strigosozonata HHB-11173 SS5]
MSSKSFRPAAPSDVLLSAIIPTYGPFQGPKCRRNILTLNRINGGPTPGGDQTRVTQHPSDDEDLDEHSEDDDAEYEEDDEDEYEDEEPALKYERLGGPIHDLLQRDSASALAIANKLLALGTHAGIVHILDLAGKRIKSFKPHGASVCDITMDSAAEFVATASMDGQIVIHTLNPASTESYVFDMKRPMRTVSLEPDFHKRSTRAFVCGGMAGALVLHEKGWLGHKETTLSSGEGPVWVARWKGRLIAWANDLGVKVYDTTSQTRITYIDRPSDSPRADLFKCTLHWQDDSTLLIAWADQIKVARVRARPRNATAPNPAGHAPLIIEITAVFQMDCMIAGIVPHPTPSPSNLAPPPMGKLPTPSLTSFLLLAYTPPDSSFHDEVTANQARRAAERPELRIVSRAGEELAADALSVSGYERWGCNDYILAEVDDADSQGRCYIVVSPKDAVVVKPRDRRDHIAWLVERRRYEEALEEVQKLGDADAVDDGVNVVQIGQRYIEHLVSEGDFGKAAHLCPKVCGQDSKRWEDWIFVFAQKHELQAIIPYVPTESPKLSHLVYEMILGHFLAHDRDALLQTIKKWPRTIYDISAIIVAVHAVLDRTLTSSPTGTQRPLKGESALLMECLAEMYTANRQPGKALPYFLRLRRPNVFDLIREHNLFTSVQDQALLLMEFDAELMEKRRIAGEIEDATPKTSVELLVDNTHSIPVARVVQQLQNQPYFLFLYLDSLFAKDPHLASDFADTQVKLCAEHAPSRLIDFLRASNYYSLEQAYRICQEKDLVPEMVFLLGRMGNNRQALTLIIERLGDVRRAIDFAKEQNDDDLWEDLLRYSETRPPFIRGLLENVGPEIDPIRLIRRIRNGLEIPGLKGALIKILQDFNLQISLLEGCQTIMHGDCSDLSRTLHKDQTSGFLLSAQTRCPICREPIVRMPQSLTLLFLCRHVVHAGCVHGLEDLPQDPESTLIGISGRTISSKLAFAAVVHANINRGCPVCHKLAEGERT